MRIEQVERPDPAVNPPVRLGSDHGATAPLVHPVIHAFRATHPTTPVEVVTSPEADVCRLLLAGSLDLGLVTLLAGDEPVAGLESAELVRGRVAVCCRADSPLAALRRVSPATLRREPLIAMRHGCAMRRYLQRLPGDRALNVAFAADGAEMAKLMVAQGLGATILPDYSIAGDPLEHSGIITHRPLATEDAAVALAVQRSRTRRLPVPARLLLAALVEQASAGRPVVLAGDPAPA